MQPSPGGTRSPSPQRERQASPQRERLPGQTRTAQLVDAIRTLSRVQKYSLWDTRSKEDLRRFQERVIAAVKGETDCIKMAAKISEALRAAADEYRARAAAEKAQDVKHIQEVMSRTSTLAEGREAAVAAKIKAAQERRAQLEAQLVNIRRAIDAQTGRTPALEEKRKQLREIRAKNMMRQECLDRLDWAVALNEPTPRPLFTASGSSSSLSTSPPKGVSTLQRQGSPSPGVLLATLRRAAAQPSRPAVTGSQSTSPPSSSPLAHSDRPIRPPSEQGPVRQISPAPGTGSLQRPTPGTGSLQRPASPQRAVSPTPLANSTPTLRSSPTASVPPSSGSAIQRPVSPSPNGTLQRPVSPSPNGTLQRPVSPNPSGTGTLQRTSQQAGGEEARLLYVQRGLASTGASIRGINAQWQPDAEAPQCRSCRARFSFTLRRHHCRLCGYIFCGDCSSKRVRIPSMLLGPGALKGEALQEQRVCNKCYNAIMIQEPPP